MKRARGCLEIVVIILFTAGQMFLNPLAAQFPQLNFDQLTSKDGLVQGSIRSIYQDKDGFMWFGRRNGLDMYDGKKYINYYNLISDTTLLVRQEILTICEDSYGGIWSGLDTTSLVLFNKRNEVYKRFTHDPDNNRSLSSNKVTMIHEDSRKNLWIATLGGGLNLFNREDSTFTCLVHDPGDNQSIGSNNISALAEDSKGILWLASPDGYICKFDPVNKTFENHKVAKPFLRNEPYINTPTIYVDSDDNVWYGGTQGLYIFNPSENRLNHYPLINPLSSLNYTYITSIIEFEKDLFLLGTFYEGLFLFNPKTREFRNYSSSLNDASGIIGNQILDLYKSNDGTIWIGFLQSGINFYNKNMVRFWQLSQLVDYEYAKYSEKRTFSVCEAPDGKILMGTERNGVLVYDPKRKSIQSLAPELEGLSVYGLFTAQNNNIWIATINNGPYIYEWDTKKIRNVPGFPEVPSKRTKEDAYRVFEDSKKRMWIGYMGSGLDLFDATKNTLSDFRYDAKDSSSLSSNRARKIFEDTKKNIWIGTNNGLNLFNEQSNSFIRIPFQLKNGNLRYEERVFDIFEDSGGRLWIGSESGISLYNPLTKTIEHIIHITDNEIIDGNIILEDSNHSLWFSSSTGIYKYNPSTREFKDYSMLDNLSSLSFNLTSGLRSHDGLMYFGSRKGVTVFRPENITDNTFIPPVFITGLIINNIPVKVTKNKEVLSQNIIYTKSIVLNYTQSNVSFEFAALSYCNSRLNQYAYKLEGFDSDWKYCGNSNQANYTNLKPGRYVFKVIASNHHGIWNETGTQLSVFIRPPFWNTWWFRLLVFLTITAILLIGYRNRVDSLRKQKKNLEEMVSQRTQALNEANHELMEHREELKQQNELLNQMSQKILNQNKKLELHYNELEKLVEERTFELEKAKDKAEESDRLKSAFLANMSHEIRTPMNAIVGFSNLLKDENMTFDEKVAFVEIINASSDTLLVLIDDILDLSMIEANQLVITRDVLDLNEFLDNLYSSFSLMNSKENLVIKLNNDQHNLNLKINSDKTRIKQILTNLLSNAIKFTNSGSIELGLKKQSGNLAFYVKDTGIGIARDDLDSIFERFRKSDQHERLVFRGAGLGLAISKALSKLLGGDLTVESELGKGSTFTLILPETVISIEETFVRQISANADLKKQWSDKNVLIVEDEKANYMYVYKMLSQTSMKTHWAENGDAAVKMISEGAHFNLILMDIKMPVMDGFEATKIIKSRIPGQIIIALTAYARPEDRTRFIEAGFDDYLTKPIKPQEFMSVINRYL